MAVEVIKEALNVKGYRVYVVHVVLAVACVLALTAGPALRVYGQGPVTNCNGLSDADCQILQDSLVAMQGVTSFAVPAWSVEASLDAEEQSIRFATNGSGAVMLPPSLMALATSYQGVMLDYTNLDAIIELYQQINSELILQMLAETGLYVVIEDLELQAPDQTLSVSADLIYKDQSFYMRTESPTGAEAWFGDTLELTPEDLAELDTSLADMITQLQSEEFQEAWAQMSEFTGISEKFTELVNKYIVTARGADAEMDGQAMIVFTTTFDIKGLLSDPELPTLLMELINNPALAELGAETGDQESINEAQLQFIFMTLGLILPEASFSAEQWIGADDQYIHKYSMNASINVDLSLLGEESEIQKVTADGSFSIELSGFNTDVMADVEVPTDYYDLEEADNFLAGGPEMIEQELELGQTFAASVIDSEDDRDIYSLMLDAGQTVQIELTSEDYPYLNLYGPDGFLAAEFDTYYDDALEFTAEEAGMYLVVVEAYWAMDYEITIRAQ
jgi:hypothetical protein